MPSSGKPGDIRDAYIARCCAILAFFESGRLHGDMPVVGKVLVDLIGYTRVSPAVKSIATQLAIDIIAITDSATVTSVVIPVLEKYKADINPEELAIHIALRAKHRSISKPFLSTRWKHKDPLHVDNLDRIGKVLQGISSDSRLPHPVWAVIAEYLNSGDASTSIADFWNATIEKSKGDEFQHESLTIVIAFFTPAATQPQKILGMKALVTMFPRFKDNTVS